MGDTGNALEELAPWRARPVWIGVDKRRKCETRAASLVVMVVALITALVVLTSVLEGRGDDCRITRVIHILQTPGCDPVTIPSYSCVGKCTSYVQVSGSKMWQMERSCMCCQESGEREATVTLSCPKAPPGSPKVQKIVTKAPVDCMCRPCTAVDEGSILPQEMAGFLEDGPPLSIVPFRMMSI